MKRFLTMAVVGVLALGLSSVAYANYCAFDPVPASTLLFPFVAYDYNGGDNGQTTLFAITNVSSEATIVHITVWSDFSVAVLDFNLTLTGYDVQTINIRDILEGGFLPTEDPLGDGGMIRDANIWAEDNEGGVFPTGPYSPNNSLITPTVVLPGGGLPAPEATWDGVDGSAPQAADWYLRCDPDDLATAAVEGWISSPVNYLEPIDDNTLGVFKLYLQSSQSAAKAHTTCDWATDVDFDTWFVNRSVDDVTWMYITADVVWACNKDLPDGNADTYFADPFAVASNGVRVSNVLVGDSIWLDRANNFSEADQAVHIEGFPGNFGNTPSGAAGGKSITFYSRYHFGDATLNDYREPLPTAWALRYFNNDAAPALSWVRAWKGTTLSAINPDLYAADWSGDDEPDPICSGPSGVECLNPTELYANSCAAYTVYIWDEDENVNDLDDPGAQDNPWSGGSGPGSTSFEIPNLLALETQEVPSSQFFLVDDFGWMMFIWPQSNGDPNTTGDFYQTWMGARFQAFGTYSAGLTGSVLGNYNCNSSHMLPILAIGTNSFSE